MPQTISPIPTFTGTTDTLALTAATLIKATKGRLVKISVLVAGSAVGSANDASSIAGASASNQFAVIPNTVGVVSLDWPCANGIVVTPGTGQTISVDWS